MPMAMAVNPAPARIIHSAPRVLPGSASQRAWMRLDIAMASRIQARWLALPGNTRGALWMILAGAGFTAMAIGIKVLGTRLDVYQVAFFRIFIGFVVIWPIVGYVGMTSGWDFLRTRHLHVHAIRGFLGMIAMYC